MTITDTKKVSELQSEVSWETPSHRNVSQAGVLLMKLERGSSSAVEKSTRQHFLAPTLHIEPSTRRSNVYTTVEQWTTVGMAMGGSHSHVNVSRSHYAAHGIRAPRVRAVPTVSANKTGKEEWTRRAKKIVLTNFSFPCGKKEKEKENIEKREKTRKRKNV